MGESGYDKDVCHCLLIFLDPCSILSPRLCFLYRFLYFLLSFHLSLSSSCIHSPSLLLFFCSIFITFIPFPILFCHSLHNLPFLPLWPLSFFLFLYSLLPSSFSPSVPSASHLSALLLSFFPFLPDTLTPTLPQLYPPTHPPSTSLLIQSFHIYSFSMSTIPPFSSLPHLLFSAVS